jgi:hypothetical protein
VKLIMLASILLAAGSARADEIATREVAGPVEHPALMKSERACTASPTSGLARTKTLELPGVRVEILHQCNQSSAMSSLAIETGAGWFIEDGFTIEDIEGNMSDPRFHYSLAGESLARGTLADGSPAIVYRSIARHDMVTRDAKVVDSQLVADVMICSVHDGVRCGRIEYACPATGCAPVTFTRGVLTTLERHEYTYKSSP